MSLAGQGAVAIWHDIAQEGREAFYAWHGREHMPERVGIPGFLRGRRYIAVAGAPEFFNLYETATTAVLSGPDYLARLNDPTPWTAATLKHFRTVARSLCEVAVSEGAGSGGLCATFRYDVGPTRASIHRAAMKFVLRDLVRAHDIAGAHLLVADEDASAVETAERRARGGERNLIPRWIVLVESWGDADAFALACRRFRESAAFAEVSDVPQPAIYRLQYDLQKG